MNSSSASVPPPSRIRSLLFPVLLVLGCLLLTSCQHPFTSFTSAAAVSAEKPARLVVRVRPKLQSLLHDVGVKAGVPFLRESILKFTSGWDWGGACRVSPFACTVSYLRSRFRSDVQTRGDLWQAITQAQAGKRCLAWTVRPPAATNFTHRGCPA